MKQLGKTIFSMIFLKHNMDMQEFDIIDEHGLFKKNI